MNRAVLFLGILFLGFCGQSQAQRNDFATWNYCNFNYKLNENLSLSLSEHMIRNENATESWLYFHDLSINQWLTKNVTQELHVRYIQQKDWMIFLRERNCCIMQSMEKCDLAVSTSMQEVVGKDWYTGII